MEVVVLDDDDDYTLPESPPTQDKKQRNVASSQQKPANKETITPDKQTQTGQRAQHKSRSKARKESDSTHLSPTSAASDEKIKKTKTPQNSEKSPPRERRKALSFRLSAETSESQAFNDLWVSKYAPCKVADLAVPKVKVQQLAEALVECIHHSIKPPPPPQPRVHMLVLTGPAGCGKTAALKCVVNEIGSFTSTIPEIAGITKCTLVEYASPTQYSHIDVGEFGVDKDTETPEAREDRLQQLHQRLDRDGIDILTGLSFSSRLKHFLAQLAGHKYSVLPTSTSAPLSDNVPNVLLVEDIPYLHNNQQKAEFRKVVESFLRYSRYQPVVFIVSDIDSGTSAARNLFGDLLEAPQIRVIKFNAVTKANVVKVLSKIATAEGVSLCSQSRLSEIAESAGDLRSAIAALQFDALWNKTPQGQAEVAKLNTTSATGRGKKRKRSAMEDEPSSAIKRPELGWRDTSLTLFQALGKILYNKRLKPDGEESLDGLEALRELYAHTDIPQIEVPRAPGLRPLRVDINSPYWRPPVKSSPEAVLQEYVNTETEWFVNILQENYLHFYSKPSDAAAAALYLSDADILMRNSWQNETAKEQAALLAMHSLQYCNTAPPPRTMYKFTAPFHRTAERERAENSQIMQEIFLASMSPPSPLAPRNTGFPSRNSVALELLPYVHKILKSMRTNRIWIGADQVQFIEKMCRYGVYRSGREINPDDGEAALEEDDAPMVAHSRKTSHYYPQSQPVACDYFDPIVD